MSRLEHSAATIAAKLCDCRELEYEFDRVCIWTDATIGSRYILNKSTRFQTFIVTRLNTIHSLTPVEQWWYADSHNNPADLGSCGLMPNEIDSAALWFSGPEFLPQTNALWPKLPDLIAHLNPRDPEIKETKRSVLGIIAEEPRICYVSYLH